MNSDMIKEKSCGAIVYKKEEDFFFLILEHVASHYSFPKGHVEDMESELDTAKREIKEETNLDVEIDSSFRKISTYSPKKGVIKDVIFFLATPKTFEIVVQKEEINSAKWYSYEDAMVILTYDKDRELLKDAYDYLMKSK